MRGRRGRAAHPQHASRPHPQVLQRFQPTSATRSSTASSSPGVNALKDRVEQEDLLAGGRRHSAMDDDERASPACSSAGARRRRSNSSTTSTATRASRSCSACSSTGSISDKTGLLFGFPDVFPAPVSRWKSPLREDILKVPALEIVADSEEAGPNMLVEVRSARRQQRALPPPGLYPQPPRI